MRLIPMRCANCWLRYLNFDDLRLGARNIAGGETTYRASQHGFDPGNTPLKVSIRPSKRPVVEDI